MNAEATVKKLLRVARRAQGHEAQVARARAEEMMARHGLRVCEDDLEERREEVAGVAGSFWKEQLLIAVAGVHRCRTGKDRAKMLVMGDGADVEATLRSFAEACFRLRLRLWSGLTDRGILKLRGEKKEVFRKAFLVYARLFLNGAVDAAVHGAAAVAAAGGSAPPPDAPGATAALEADDDVEDEVDLLEADLNALARLIGMKAALRLKAMAENDAMVAGASVELRRPSTRMLPQRGSDWPNPSLSAGSSGARSECRPRRGQA